MVKGQNIEDRLVGFGVRIIRLCGEMPRSYAGKHLATQLLRSGTAPAAHYAEARGAESINDFIHKLKICLKELNESQVWLRMISESGLLAINRLTDIVQECAELSRMINASISTAKKNNPTK